MSTVRNIRRAGHTRITSIYACKHPTGSTGHRCDYHKQWGQDIVNDAVVEVIRNMVSSPKFAKGIKEKINSRIDTSELEQELAGLQKTFRQLTVSKDKIAAQMDNLDVTGRIYDRKYADLQKRFDEKYDEMAQTENHMEEIVSRISNVKQDKISADRIYKYLLGFDKLYDTFADAEKKEFMQSIVESVEIYPQRLSDRRFLKSIIQFRFPVYYNGQEIDNISWENESGVETVCLLSKLSSAKHHIEVTVDMDELDLSSTEAKATYKEIQEWVKEKYGLHVTNLNIAQVKQKHGIIERENFAFSA